LVLRWFPLSTSLYLYLVLLIFPFFTFFSLLSLPYQYDRDHLTVEHGAVAVRSMQWVASFFVGECRAKGVGPGDVEQTPQPAEFYPSTSVNGYSSTLQTLEYVFSG
jgi:hypothetical protein